MMFSVAFRVPRTGQLRCSLFRQTAASLTTALGDKLIGVLTAGIAAMPVIVVQRHRLFELPLNSGW